MPYLSVELSKETWDALHELAAITEPEGGEDRVVQLLEDSIRTYEWIVHQQLQGNVLTALHSSDMEFLEQGPLEGERDYVAPLFPADKRAQVADYFKKAA